MFQNRLQSQVQTHRTPRPQEPVPAWNGFMFYPFSWWQSGSIEQQQIQQRIYQIAWENAQAMTRPSLPERDLFAVWN
jgi:hypothetical protein